MSNCRTLSFKNLPGTSKLFLDFLYDFEKVAPYYCADFRNIERFKNNAENISNTDYKRSELVEILTEQNKSFNLGQTTFDNINKLKDKKTCVVFTGQQVGFLTGPLYTIYKTLTTIKLAKKLSADIGVHVIPVFWMAADDHDFDEISHVHVIDNKNHVSKFVYEPDNYQKDVPVAFLDLDDNINSFLDNVFSELIKTEYFDEIEKLVRDAYQPGVSICEAFGKLMGKLFAESGLVIVNPADKRIKQLAVPLFKKEIEEFKSSNQIIQIANAELDNLGYHTQVTRPEEYLNLFYFSGKRSRIGYKDSHYFIDGIDKKYSRDDLIKEIENNPNYFSPNVLFRPVMQDFIFPTLAYIGGPSEVAYFAQIKDLHNHFKVQCPIVFPRISATILNKQAENIAEKYDLNVCELIDEKALHAKINSLVEERVPDKLTYKLDNDREHINKLILEIDDYIQDLDEGIRKTVQKSKGKVEYELKSLREKLIKAYKKKNEDMVNAIERAMGFLYPDYSLQERHLNVLTFINRYGFDFIEKLSENLELDDYDHQVISTDEMGL